MSRGGRPRRRRAGDSAFGFTTKVPSPTRFARAGRAREHPERARACRSCACSDVEALRVCVEVLAWPSVDWPPGTSIDSSRADVRRNGAASRARATQTRAVGRSTGLPCVVDHQERVAHRPGREVRRARHEADLGAARPRELLERGAPRPWRPGRRAATAGGEDKRQERERRRLHGRASPSLDSGRAGGANAPGSES